MARHCWVMGVVLVSAIAGVLVAGAGEPLKDKGSWQRPSEWAKIVADPRRLAEYRCPPPREFAIVFSFGYSEDYTPKDDAKFEQMLLAAKAAGFNVIHTSYTPQRVELCRKHGMMLMIDFLDTERHHVTRSADKCQAVAKAVEGDPAVWGYNVWNDHFGGREAGHERDINSARAWDPSHPSYCGGCANDNDRLLTNADMAGYYDFHWERGIMEHFPHLVKFLGGARQYNGNFMAIISGRPASRHGKPRDFFHRSRWSVHTSIAFGSKGISWFLAPMNRDTLQWTDGIAYIKPVNLEVYPMRAELMKIGLPTAVYATNAAHGFENESLGGPRPVAGLEKNAFPADFWAQPAGGEFVMGVYRYADGTDALYVANLNSQAEQVVALKLARPAAEIFDRATGGWRALPVTDGTLRFPLAKGGGELLRLPNAKGR